MTKDMRWLTQAKRNADDGISVIQTAGSAMGQMTDILTRMKELAVQANSDVLNDSQRDNLNEEFEQLQLEIDSISNNTEFNDIPLLNTAGAITIQIGVDATDTIAINTVDLQAATLGIDSTAISLDSATGDPATAQTAIDAAMDSLLSERATLGGLQNRMEMTVENIANLYENTAASKGRIIDVDVASEMAEFTKNQVLMQAGSSMLAQANSQPQNALALLGG